MYRLITAGTIEERSYEKQIHKDGIKNQVLSSGSATKRHFTKNDLKKMFTLGVRGECLMLGRFGKNIQPSRISSHLEAHPCSLGLSSHDDIYAFEEVNVEEEDETIDLTQKMKTMVIKEAFGSPRRKIVKSIRATTGMNCHDKENCNSTNNSNREIGGKMGRSARILMNEKANAAAIDLIPLVNKQLNSMR